MSITQLCFQFLKKAQINVCVYECVWLCVGVIVLYGERSIVRERFKKSLLRVIIRNIRSIEKKVALLIKKVCSKSFSLVGFSNLLPKSYCLSLESV